MSAPALLIRWIACLLAGIFTFQGPAPVISAPQEGDTLQGQVVVYGTSAVEGFAGMELAYAYENGREDWFFIAQSDQPVQSGELAAWDTTAIADGDYRLRLRVMRQSGQTLEMVVRNLQVRNYTPAATRQPTAASTPVDTSVAGLLSTPTRLPANPAQVQPAALALRVVQGVIFVGVIFGLLGLYYAVRAWFRHFS